MCYQAVHGPPRKKASTKWPSANHRQGVGCPPNYPAQANEPATKPGTSRINEKVYERVSWCRHLRNRDPACSYSESCTIPAWITCGVMSPHGRCNEAPLTILSGWRGERGNGVPGQVQVTAIASSRVVIWSRSENRGRRWSPGCWSRLSLGYLSHERRSDQGTIPSLVLLLMPELAVLQPFEKANRLPRRTDIARSGMRKPIRYPETY